MQGVVEYDISPIRGPLANAFIMLINALFFNVKLIGLYDVYPRDYSQRLLNEEETIFDFIIVGAGTAGCTLANRISEYETFSVLLIEAGDYPSSSTEVPALFTVLVGSKEDWHFQIDTGTKICQATSDGKCFISRGKVLGGSSSINNMLYIRGPLEEYEKNSAEKWSPNITQQIFDSIEGYKGGDCPMCSFGHTGPIHIENFIYSNTPRELLGEAYRSSGYVAMPKRQSIGFIDNFIMIKDGERFNLAKAFLSPVKDRPNLFFSKNTVVEAIGITEPVDKRANGVNVSIDGTKFFIRARKEVILTTGAINNAKLLLYSGIGPKDYLAEKNIKLNADVPGVGKHLKIRLEIPLFFSIEPPSVCHREYYTEQDLIKDTFEYVMYRIGNLSHTNINNFVNYIRTKKIGSSLPNLAIYHMYFKIGDRNLMAWLDSKNYHPKIMNALLKQNQEKSLILFLVNSVDPLSEGEILLNSTHFGSNPQIKGNFFSDDHNFDYENFVRGIDYVTNLTDHIKNYHAEFLDLDVPNCRNFKFCSKPYVDCYIHNMAVPTGDIVGTAKMGPDCEKSSVVKDSLEVKKIRCLRVADSSVFQNIPLGNSVAVDAMIGYMMGEILKEKWIKDYIPPFSQPE